MKKFIFLLVLSFASKFTFSQQITQEELLQKINTWLDNDQKQKQLNILEAQQNALENINNSMSALKAGSFEEAESYAKDASVQWKWYSVPYIVRSYVYLKRNDFLNSHRMLNLYALVKGDPENENLEKIIPEGLIHALSKKSDEGLVKLTNKDLKSDFAKEPWLRNAVYVGLMPKLIGLDVGDDNKFLFSFFGSYSRFIWFDRKNSSYLASNNYGMEISGGFNYNLNSYSNDTTLSASNSWVVTPGFYLKKIFIAPFSIVYSSLPDYSKAISTPNLDEVSPLHFEFSPEFRFYPGRFNVYAGDRRKIPKEESKNLSQGYLLFQYKKSMISGMNDQRIGYFENKTVFNFGGSMFSPNGIFNICFYFGFGSLNYKYENINSNFIIKNKSSSFLNAAIAFRYRIL